MIDGIDYSPDGKFLVMEQRWMKDEPQVKVPVVLIDELLERRLSRYDLENLMTARNMLGENSRRVDIASLVGQDLTGKSLSIYFRNYEDSEWMTTDNAVTVVAEENGYYRFVFTEHMENCWKGECGHDDDGEQCSEYDQLQGTTFIGQETVIIHGPEE